MSAAHEGFFFCLPPDQDHERTEFASNPACPWTHPQGFFFCLPPDQDHERTEFASNPACPWTHPQGFFFCLPPDQDHEITLPPQHKKSEYLIVTTF
jgi:hypothetical protein